MWFLQWLTHHCEFGLIFLWSRISSVSKRAWNVAGERVVRMYGSDWTLHLKQTFISLQHILQKKKKKNADMLKHAAVNVRDNNDCSSALLALTLTLTPNKLRLDPSNTLSNVPKRGKSSPATIAFSKEHSRTSWERNTLKINDYIKWLYNYVNYNKLQTCKK